MKENNDLERRWHRRSWIRRHGTRIVRHNVSGGRNSGYDCRRFPEGVQSDVKPGSSGRRNLNRIPEDTDDLLRVEPICRSLQPF